MDKYVCSICGFIYDEAAGCSEAEILPGTKWSDVPSSFLCPLCGASKEEFFKKEEKTTSPSASSQTESEVELPEDISYTGAELSAIFSNLAKGSEKQYYPEMSALYQQLSSYYGVKPQIKKTSDFESLKTLLEKDLSSNFIMANEVAGKFKDRGALRALKWSEGVSRMTKAHLGRFNTSSPDLIENTKVFVCDICGFIFIGDEKPEVCPVCKVPSMKMTQIKRGA
jgi:rubredoxin